MTRERPGWLLPVLIVATVVATGSIIINLAMMMMSPMMFDSGESRGAWTAFIAVWTAPLVILLGIVLGWIGYARHGTKLATAGIALMALPLAAVLAVAGVLPV